MSEESSQDKTEEPTAQRLSKAREDGQIARSQELAPAAMMVIATLFFSMMGHHIFNSMSGLFKQQLQLKRSRRPPGPHQPKAAGPEATPARTG